MNSSPSAEADDTLRRWLAGHRETLRVRLEERFSAEQARGESSTNHDPRTMARFVLTLAGGIAVEAQSGASRRDLLAMIDLSLQVFGSREATASPAGNAMT